MLRHRGVSGGSAPDAGLAARTCLPLRARPGQTRPGPGLL